MASHLTVTTAANPGVAVKGLNAQASAETGTDALGAFAALLGSLGGATPSPSSQSGANPAGLLNLGLDAGTDSGEQPDTSPDALAAAIDAVLPIQTVSPQPVLADAIDALIAFRDAIARGEVPSPEDLAKLGEGLDALAEALGVSLDTLPTMDELAAMAAQVSPDGGALQDQLVGAFAPLAYGLLTDPPGDAAAADQLKAIGDKLAALLKGLDDGEIDPEKLAALGLGDDAAPLDDELQAAIARLLKPAAAEVASTAQVFTAPKLDVTEAALTGKASATAEADGAASTETADPLLKADPALKADAEPQSGSDNTGDKRDQKETKVNAPIATIATQIVETAPDAQGTGQIGTTKIEVTPAARPIIAGYQTSQQQLNLPQIAFELVRQVNDGNSRFQMRLDPPEMGRIDVRLDIDAAGNVNGRLIVEKAETLDLMQRDQRALEKALQQAGLDGAKTNLEFSLKQNSSGQQGRDDQNGQPFFGGDVSAVEDIPAPTVNLYRASLSAGGVNIIA